MNPMPKGEGLVSSLHRNSKGEPSALVSSPTHQGTMTRSVLAHRGRTTCKQEALFPCTILPCVAMQEPDEAQAGVCANRPPCGRVPISTTPVAIQQGALALSTSSFREEENRK